jgi:hypothetical protein
MRQQKAEFNKFINDLEVKLIKQLKRKIRRSLVKTVSIDISSDLAQYFKSKYKLKGKYAPNQMLTDTLLSSINTAVTFRGSTDMNELDESEIIKFKLTRKRKLEFLSRQSEIIELTPSCPFIFKMEYTVNETKINQ